MGLSVLSQGLAKVGRKDLEGYSKWIDFFLLRGGVGRRAGVEGCCLSRVLTNASMSENLKMLRTATSISPWGLHWRGDPPTTEGEAAGGFYAFTVIRIGPSPKGLGQEGIYQHKSFQAHIPAVAVDSIATSECISISIHIPSSISTSTSISQPKMGYPALTGFSNFIGSWS